LLPFNHFLHYNIEEENYNSLKPEIIVAGLQVQQIIRTVVNKYGLLFFVLHIKEVKMSKKRLISLLIAMILLFSSIIPVRSAFAAGTRKYHPDDWFGYHHSQAEIAEWIKDAVKYPATSEEAIKALKGEIRPGDIISFQLEVEMPTGHGEIVQFLENFSLNMTLPFGANTMIEVYASDAPLLTDEAYQEKISEFNNKIDELEQRLNDEELIKDIESDKETMMLYNTYKDMVINRDKYYDIYLSQIETARTKYGFIDESYGTVDNWMGLFENNPNIDLDEGETYDSYREKLIENSWIAPKFTDEEFESAVSEFNEKYPSIIEEYTAFFEEAKEAYDCGELSENDWLMVTTAMESIDDGTFYDTVIQYFAECHDGYYQYSSDYFPRFIALALSGKDSYNAYLGQYKFDFSDNKVQRNQQCTYIFDINIVATDALTAGNYLSFPSLTWYYLENCPTQYWVSEGFLKGHWEDYYTCNSSYCPFIKFANIYYVNNLFCFNDNTSDLENYMCSDKRYFAFDYIISEYENSEYANKLLFDYGEKFMKDNVLRAIRPLTVECRDEYGKLIKSETVEIFDSYYDIYPEEIFDYQLVEPENIKGVVESGETTVTFYYEHKDVELKVSYVDFDGNELIPAGKLTGKTLDSYQAIPAEINGYNVVIIPENASGVLHEDSSDIQFVYKLKPATVSVNYLDVDGKQIINSEIIYGRVFDEYNTVPKEIDGYELVEIPENASGKMTEEDISVDYIYRLMYS